MSAADGKGGEEGRVHRERSGRAVFAGHASHVSAWNPSDLEQRLGGVGNVCLYSAGLGFYVSTRADLYYYIEVFIHRIIMGRGAPSICTVCVHSWGVSTGLHYIAWGIRSHLIHDYTLGSIFTVDLSSHFIHCFNYIHVFCADLSSHYFSGRLVVMLYIFSMGICNLFYMFQCRSIVASYIVTMGD